MDSCRWSARPRNNSNISANSALTWDGPRAARLRPEKAVAGPELLGKRQACGATAGLSTRVRPRPAAGATSRAEGTRLNVRRRRREAVARLRGGSALHRYRLAPSQDPQPVELGPAVIPRVDIFELEPRVLQVFSQRNVAEHSQLSLTLAPSRRMASRMLRSTMSRATGSSSR